MTVQVRAEEQRVPARLASGDVAGGVSAIVELQILVRTFDRLSAECGAAARRAERTLSSLVAATPEVGTADDDDDEVLWQAI